MSNEQRERSTTPIGTRVGAILCTQKRKLFLLGYGTYEGLKPIPKDAGALAGLPNPCLKLDNGQTVYGMDCWWGPEEQIKERVDADKAEGWDIIETTLAKGVRV